MTAFLFIPTSVGGVDARRVDFGNIASLFAEREEPAPRLDATRLLFRVAAAALLFLLLVGDLLLVTRPSSALGLPVRAAMHLTL